MIFISVCTTGSLSGPLPPEMVKALGIATFGELGAFTVQPVVPTPVTSAAARDGPPFVLSEALPVVPFKLVKRREFVDMAELLQDNMEVERRRAASAGEGGQQSQAINSGSRREMPDMLSWLHCFSLYAAIADLSTLTIWSCDTRFQVYFLTISRSVIYKSLRSNSILSVKYRHALPVRASLLLLRSTLAWQLKFYYGFWG